MDLEGFLLSEIIQTGKENYIFFFTFIWNLFVYFHSYLESTKKKKIARNRDTKNKLLPEGRVEEWVKKVKGSKRYKLPIIK